MESRRCKRNERGAAFVEFVIVLPFFLFLTFALISFGGLFTFRQTLSQAATEGARAAVIAPTYSTFAVRSARAVTAINEAFAGELGGGVTCGSGGLTCTIPSTPTSCGSSAECISVTLTYDYAHNPRIPVPQFLTFTLPNTVTYTASARIK
jgi:Flp pilus assembly protein TadG